MGGKLGTTHSSGDIIEIETWEKEQLSRYTLTIGLQAVTKNKK